MCKKREKDIVKIIFLKQLCNVSFATRIKTINVVYALIVDNLFKKSLIISFTERSCFLHVYRMFITVTSYNIKQKIKIKRIIYLKNVSHRVIKAIESI